MSLDLTPEVTGESTKDEDHKWALTPIVKVFTCQNCGILKLKTLSGSHYFIKFNESDSNCSLVKKAEPKKNE